ncbi:DUF2334 domain-containing protein [Tepidibacillus sp. LV47]|uniref:DUF2334 domain-containing protein n=1 Tax=Tepidibacillus sp. LV47 TaxID=3398228 RepID=UPI003AAF19AD
MAKRALIRLEDLGPYDYYTSEESIIKLKVIADYLYSENVHFHASVIPRIVYPANKYNKSIGDVTDPVVASFNDTMRYFLSRGGTLSIHGYTHQYGLSISGLGFEFSSHDCSKNCPPDDQSDACTNAYAFRNSYASRRMRMAFDTFRISRLPLSYLFVTPHYAASPTQRCIMEAWTGIFFEDDPLNPTKRTLTIRDTDHPFYRGVVYIPTRLGYVRGSDPNYDVERICREAQTFTEQDLAGLYYHPILDFPFIHISETGEIQYDENSYLKRIIRCMKEHGFKFVSADEVVHFSPNVRQTDFFGGTENVFLTADVNADHKTDFIIWQPKNGTWFFGLSNLENYPSRQDVGGFSSHLALTNWAISNIWKPLTGDFNGDKQSDVVVWNSNDGDWQVALSNGSRLIPTPGKDDFSWIKSWGIGEHWIPFVGDFNGDGKDDIMIRNPHTGEWKVALSNGQYFIEDGNWLQTWAKGENWVSVVGDFNGDGKTDVAVWLPENGNWQVAISDGARFVPQGSWLRNYASSRIWKAYVGDFNGDGKDDILVVDTVRGDWQVALSTGKSFTPIWGAFEPWAAGKDTQPLVGDFHGTGKTCICARQPNLRNGTIDFAISLFPMDS